ncbi:MAG: TolC family protein [Flammeovirgaceae bacterium]|nr:TolC family protein [Flammeovirgaceae bacterium]
MRLSVFAFLFLIALQSFSQEKITLEQVIVLALEKNYDVKISANLAEAAKTDKNFTPAAFLPTVTATGSRVWNSNDQRQEFADTVRQADNVKSNNLSGSIQLIWTLFDGTKMFAVQKGISELERQSQINLKDQMVNTTASVITNYYNIVRQKQQYQAIEEQMYVNEERVKLADRKLQVGVGGKPELLQAKVDLNAQKTLLIQQETVITQLKDQLNGLVGQQLPVLYDVDDTISLNLDLSLNELTEGIEQNNFTLQSAKSGLTMAYLSLNELKADRYPIVNFNSSLNYSRTENVTVVNPFTPLFNQNDGFNYGFSVTLPLLNRFNTQRQIQQARININRQELLYEQQKQQIDVNVRNAFVNYENAKKVLLIEEENILLAKENVTIALESFKRGVATNIELRTAQQSLADAYNRLITARYNAKVAETELLRLNGDLLR